MNMEDNDIPGSYRYCAKNLEYVHFSDTARLYPGGGNVDFKTHMRCLKEIGYQGYITTECVPLPTAYDCADLGLKYMKAMEQIVDIERGRLPALPETQTEIKKGAGNNNEETGRGQDCPGDRRRRRYGCL